MIRYPAIFGLIYMTAAVQSNLSPAAPEMGRLFLPATILVLVAAWVHPAMAIVCSAILGFVLDGISPERLGIQMSLAAVLALGLQIIRPLWKSQNPIALAISVVVVVVAWRVLSPITYAALSHRNIDPVSVFQQALRDAVMTSLGSLILFLVLRGMTRRSHHYASSSKVRFAC